jgi:hypothetical protein
MSTGAKIVPLRRPQSAQAREESPSETVTLPRVDSSAPREVVGTLTLPRALLDELQLSAKGLVVYRATLQDGVPERIAARDLVVVDRKVRAIEREGVYLVEIDGALRLRLCRRDEMGAVVVSAGDASQTIPHPQLARIRVLGRAVYRMGELL